MAHIVPIISCFTAFFSTFIGYAIWHPEINLNGLDCKSAKGTGCWNDEHGAAFVKAFFHPLLGYLSYPLLAGIKIAWCTSQRERNLNPITAARGDCSNLDRIFWNIQLAENKTAFPPFNNLLNNLAMIFWCGFYAAIYALVGNGVLHKIPNLDTALDIAITYAIGGAVMPAIVTSVYQIYRILFDGKLKLLPDARYWQFSSACCAFAACSISQISCATPVRWLSECCSLPKQLCCPAQVVQALEVSHAELAAEFAPRDEEDGYMRLPPPSARSQPSAPSMLSRFTGLVSAALGSSGNEQDAESQAKRPLLRIQGG